MNVEISATPWRRCRFNCGAQAIAASARASLPGWYSPICNRISRSRCFASRRRARRPRRDARSHDVVHDAAHTVQDIDGRVVIRGRELARQHQVPIENRPHFFADRIGSVFIFDQHGVEGGDRTCRGVAGALQHLRQRREYRGRKTAPGRWFAGRQADFTQRARITRDGIDQQQDALTLIAKVFGDRSRCINSTRARQCRCIRSGDDQHGTRQVTLQAVAMNSWISRPRSPISAMTFTSAAERRASMPSNVLLPPPAAAKIPSR